MQIYEPREDSHLLEESVKKLAFGRVLDMGTGSGIQAKSALSNKAEVVAADVNQACGKNFEGTRIKFVKTDLFKNVKKQKFDVITFNPPYLPKDGDVEDQTIYGGKKGYEVVEEFLRQGKDYLSKEGFVLLLFSSLTGKKDVDRLVEENCLEKEQIAEKQLPFFEKLYVYKITKSKLLKKLDYLTEIKKFAEGNRGVIYVAKQNGKKVAVKTFSKKSPVKNSITNEGKWLKILNKKGIGPRLLKAGSDYFVYEFAEGAYLTNYLNQSKKKRIKETLLDVLNQCRTMDQLNVNKQEMLRPHKHVIVGKKNVLIDFERCRKTQKPKNVTQFCQYLLNRSKTLKKKNIKIEKERLISKARKYKISQTRQNFESILNELK